MLSGERNSAIIWRRRTLCSQLLVRTSPGSLVPNSLTNCQIPPWPCPDQQDTLVTHEFRVPVG